MDPHGISMVNGGSSLPISGSRSSTDFSTGLLAGSVASQLRGAQLHPALRSRLFSRIARCRAAACATVSRPPNNSRGETEYQRLQLWKVRGGKKNMAPKNNKALKRLRRLRLLRFPSTPSVRPHLPQKVNLVTEGVIHHPQSPPAPQSTPRLRLKNIEKNPNISQCQGRLQ